MGCLLYSIYRILDDISDDPSLRELANSIYIFVIYNKLMHYDPFERPFVNGPDGVAARYKQLLTGMAYR